MEKLDLKKQHKHYYSASAKPTQVHFGKVSYISIAGKGDPSGAVFTANLQALYTTAYTIKSGCKAMGRDFVVPKLEGLWWFDEDLYPGIRMTDAPQAIPREAWQYRLLLRMPEFVSLALMQHAIKTVSELKGKVQAKDIEWYEMQEGICVQLLHTGPFEEEPKSLALLQKFMQEHDWIRNGLHHEIYLSDFRKTVPEKLKTIFREPVKQRTT